MLRKVEIVDPADSRFLRNEEGELTRALEEIERLEGTDQEPPVFRPILLGITKASLATEAFISAASFQESTRALPDAAVSGTDEHLRGRSENGMVGGLIPAGTGRVAAQRRREQRHAEADAELAALLRASEAEEEVAREPSADKS